MSDSNEKITIRPDEVVEPPSSPIVIGASDLPTPQLPNNNITSDRDAYGEDGKLTPEWDAPGRHTANTRPALTVLICFGLILGAFLMLGLMGLFFLVSFDNDETPQRAEFTATDWIESIASQANRSVVYVESGEQSLGSGFVISSHRGRHLILTNRHVIVDPTRIKVGSRKGFVTTAEVAGYPTDGEVDLALLVAEVAGLQPLGKIGQFKDVRVGEAVIAIGHPLGLGFTVTDGIVSAKRGGTELQTSVAISPGNSGGPLVNKQGEVIGVNTRIIDPTKGQALGFATRADFVLNEASWTFEQDVDGLIANIEQ